MLFKNLKMSFPFLAGLLILALGSQASMAADEPTNFRKPVGDKELEYWLQNMVWYHGFKTDEITAATGLNPLEIDAALQKFDITAQNKPKRKAGAPIRVLPFPGGRHPRIGFHEGAISPQRETKISVFTPWNEKDYVVVDLPEAIWSNLGLTYLAHTHVDTIWTKQNIDLKKLEWNRNPDGTLNFKRELPNGISFGTKIVPRKGSVHMEMWLTNGTNQKLTDMRVQNCVLLKSATGFNALSNKNKVMKSPYVACKTKDGTKWIITAWNPCHRPWANAKCPCLHSDPKFPDCDPGETKHLVGWLSFFEGKDIFSEFKRIEATGWRKP